MTVRQSQKAVQICISNKAQQDSSPERQSNLERHLAVAKLNFNRCLACM
jgi:hypothetical protein